MLRFFKAWRSLGWLACIALLAQLAVAAPHVLAHHHDHGQHGAHQLLALDAGADHEHDGAAGSHHPDGDGDETHCLICLAGTLAAAAMAAEPAALVVARLEGPRLLRGPETACARPDRASPFEARGPPARSTIA